MKRYLLTIIACLLISGCASLNNVERKAVTDRDSISGTYNLIQVGGTFGFDAERIVILDIEGDDYSFNPVTGPGRVKNFAGVKGAAALQRAEEFFASHCAYQDYQIKTLSLPGHGIIGYELVPNFLAILCEYNNEVAVSYALGDDGEIKVYTWLLLQFDKGDRDH